MWWRAFDIPITTCDLVGMYFAIKQKVSVQDR
jgi:hypothetical protein